MAESMSLDGTPIDPAATYRVTVNDFLSVGGDGFSLLKQGKLPQFGIYDVDALYRYVQDNSPITPMALSRIHRMN
jgi:5'-nucleotidase